MRQPVIKPVRVFDRSDEKNRPIAQFERQTQNAVQQLGSQKLDPSTVAGVTRSGTFRAKAGDLVRVEPPAAGVVVLLPPAAPAIKGRTVTVKKTVSGANPVAVRVADGGQVEGGTAFTTTTSLALLVFQCDGASWWRVA